MQSHSAIVYRFCKILEILLIHAFFVWDKHWWLCFLNKQKKIGFCSWIKNHQGKWCFSIIPLFHLQLFQSIFLPLNGVSNLIYSQVLNWIDFKILLDHRIKLNKYPMLGTDMCFIIHDRKSNGTTAPFIVSWEVIQWSELLLGVHK